MLDFYNNKGPVVEEDIGIEAPDGSMNVVIPKGTKLPAKAKHRYTNTQDNQTEIELNVYQGDKIVAEFNNWLAKRTI